MSAEEWVAKAQASVRADVYLWEAGMLAVLDALEGVLELHWKTSTGQCMEDQQTYPCATRRVIEESGVK